MKTKANSDFESFENFMVFRNPSPISKDISINQVKQIFRASVFVEIYDLKTASTEVILHSFPRSLFSSHVLQW